MKTCSYCKETKDLVEFYKNKKSLDGLNWHCKQCSKLHVKKYKQNNKEEVKLANKRSYLKQKENKSTYYYRNKEHCAKKSKEWKKNNPDKVRASNKKRQHKITEASRQWRKNNHERHKALALANCNKRRATRISATPNWLSKTQIEEMKQMYLNCPEGHQVDHIVPLMGKNVCGLHVPWNLQYLTEYENRSKGNKF